MTTQLILNTLSNPRLITTLQEGGVVAIPTDTVYGLATRAALPASVERQYKIKYREAKTGTIIAASIDQLVELGVKRRYLTAVEQFWPNPISIEIPLGPELAYLHKGLGRQAFRIPKSPELLALLEQTGPLVTTSVNQPGEPGATTIQEAIDYFGDELDLYVDGGDLSGRAPSTIIRIIDDAIEVIREGAVKISETGKILS